MNFITLKKIGLFSLLIGLLISCDSSKELKNDALSQIKMEMTTRGNSTSLSINKNKTIVNARIAADNTSEKQKSNQSTDLKTWEKFKGLVSDINLSQFETYPAPSQEFTFDGKRGTVIYLDVNGKTLSSQTFDEGNPPSELEELYLALIEEIK